MLRIMKKVAIVLAVLMVLLAAGGWAISRGIKAGPASWQTKQVDRGELIVKVIATGNIEPRSEVQVGSQVSGKVKRVFVEPDAVVKSGQVLAELDTELLEADRRDTEIVLEKVRTSLAMLATERQNLDLQEEAQHLKRRRGKVSVERSQANLELAAKNLRRYQDLYEVDGATQTELDMRRLERDNAERDLRLQKIDVQQLALDLKRVASDRTALAARERNARNEVEQAEQALAKAVTNLKHASIVSPTDGVVLDRSVEPGQTIAAQFQAPNLFKIVAGLGRVRVLVKIDESDVGKIRAGQKVTFEVDAYRDETFEGQVKAVRLKHETRANLVTYPVIVEADNPPLDGYPQGKLRPGMTAYVTFEVERKQDVKRVPAAALRFVPPEGVEADKSAVREKAEESSKTEAGDKKKAKERGMPATVYVLGEQGGLKALSLRVGEHDGDYYELISDELDVGDEVVTGKESPSNIHVTVGDGD